MDTEIQPGITNTTASSDKDIITAIICHWREHRSIPSWISLEHYREIFDALPESAPEGLLEALNWGS